MPICTRSMARSGSSAGTNETTTTTNARRGRQASAAAESTASTATKGKDKEETESQFVPPTAIKRPKPAKKNAPPPPRTPVKEESAEDVRKFDQNQNQGRSLRPRGPDKKAVLNHTVKPFFPGELAGTVPNVFASQCRMVSNTWLTATNTLEEYERSAEAKRLAFFREQDEILEDLRRRRAAENAKGKATASASTARADPVPEPESELSVLAEKVNSTNLSVETFSSRSEAEESLESDPNSKKSEEIQPTRARSKSTDEIENRIQPPNNKRSRPSYTDDTDLDGSADMFDFAEDDPMESHVLPTSQNINGKKKSIKFDFIAAAEKEAEPVHPSKKVIIDAIVRHWPEAAVAIEPVIPLKKSGPVSNPEPEPEILQEDVVEDVFESSVMIVDENDASEPDEPEPEDDPGATFLLPNPEASKSDVKKKSSVCDPGATFILPNSVEKPEIKKKPSPGLGETFILPKSEVEKSESKNKSPLNLGTTSILPNSDVDKSEVKKKSSLVLNETYCLPESKYGNHAPVVQNFKDYNWAASASHQVSALDMVEEEDDDILEVSPSGGAAPKQVLPLAVDVNHKSKEKEETSESSNTSSSSTGSFKSAMSHTSVNYGKPLKGITSGASSAMTAPSKKKAVEREEEAQRKKAKILQKKQELQKKKNEEWKQKADKMKLMEMEKKTLALISKPPKAPVTQPAIIKPVKFMNIARPNEFPASHKPSGPMANKYKSPMPVLPIKQIGLSQSEIGAYSNTKTPNKLLNHVQMADDVFKTPGNVSTSFLDITNNDSSGINSYDITIYEELDEDMKHRENKHVPDWATNKMNVAIGLFKQVYFRKSATFSPFPKVEYGYKLF